MDQDDFKRIADWADQVRDLTLAQFHRVKPGFENFKPHEAAMSVADMNYS